MPISPLAGLIANCYRPDVPGSLPAVEVIASGGAPTLDGIARLAQTAQSTGHGELHFLAWEFPPDLASRLRAEQPALPLPVRLVRIPRELYQPFGRKPPQFVEQGELSLEPLQHPDGSWDVRLAEFRPGLPISPKRLPEALSNRNGFDFIDYWAVDFTYRLDAPFHHQWRCGRSPRNRRIPLQSDTHWPSEATGTLAVKVVDVFGYETLARITRDR